MNVAPSNRAEVNVAPSNRADRSGEDAAGEAEGERVAAGQSRLPSMRAPVKWTGSCWSISR